MTEKNKLIVNKVDKKMYLMFPKSYKKFGIKDIMVGACDGSRIEKKIKSVSVTHNINAVLAPSP